MLNAPIFVGIPNFLYLSKLAVLHSESSTVVAQKGDIAFKDVQIELYTTTPPT